MASTHLKKVGTRPCLPLCGIPSSFITVCKRLGTEETSCSSLGIGMLSHSCLIQASSCSTVLGLLCRIFLFMMRQMFSMGERSGLQAGHFSTRILLLRSHDVVIDAVCGLALSCWKMQGLPWKRRRLDYGSMVFRPWPLRTEIVPDSLNLWMILCTVDDDNFKLFAIFLWETPFWYCSTIFRRSIGGIGDPLPILTSERHCHSERLFLYPIMLPIDLISCKLVLQLFLICTFNFSGLLLLPVPTFLECVALMKSKMSQYLAWHFKMSHFQHLICYLYSIVNKI